jgi:hypothetical protein
MIETQPSTPDSLRSDVSASANFDIVRINDHNFPGLIQCGNFDLSEGQSGSVLVTPLAVCPRANEPSLQWFARRAAEYVILPENDIV